jgi:REP element-mobilizing transposase RayT
MYDPSIHLRRSIRLKGYDYTLPGAYFITLVTHDRCETFGQIIQGKMQLSPLGQIAAVEWIKSSQIRREIAIYEDEFIVMPNHIHGIVWIRDVGADPGGIDVGAYGIRPNGIRPDNNRPDENDEAASYDEGGRRPPQPTAPVIVGADGIRPDDEDGGARYDEGGRRPPQPRPPRPDAPRRDPPGRTPRSLGSFIAGYKAAVTSRARRELAMIEIWQRNYYEHIIRTEKEFERIWNYIDTNPDRWQADQLHRNAGPNRFNQDKP